MNARSRRTDQHDCGKDIRQTLFTDRFPDASLPSWDNVIVAGLDHMASSPLDSTNDIIGPGGEPGKDSPHYKYGNVAVVHHLGRLTAQH